MEFYAAEYSVDHPAVKYFVHRSVDCILAAIPVLEILFPAGLNPAPPGIQARPDFQEGTFRRPGIP